MAKIKYSLEKDRKMGYIILTVIFNCNIPKPQSVIPYQECLAETDGLFAFHMSRLPDGGIPGSSQRQRLF